MSIFTLLESKLDKTKLKYADLLEKRGVPEIAGITFMLYSLDQIFRNFVFEQIEEGIVDSTYRAEAHDYGIDAIYLSSSNQYLMSIDELDNYNEDSKFTFHLLQFKKGRGIAQADLLKLKEGIQTAFIDGNIREDRNEYFYNRMTEILEIRNALYEKFSADQIAIKIYIVFGGIKTTVTTDTLLMKQIDDIEKLLKENGYMNVNIEIIDTNLLFDIENKGDEIVDIIESEKTLKYLTETSTGMIFPRNSRHPVKLP